LQVEETLQITLVRLPQLFHFGFSLLQPANFNVDTGAAGDFAFSQIDKVNDQWTTTTSSST
jgi:hypothetical protein